MIHAIALTTALNCMAANIYFEARNQPVLGQQAVALVTWNRAEQNLANVCSVVTAPNQFSWVGQSAKKSGKRFVASKPKDEKSWRVALLVAKQVLSNRLQDFTGGATHYHAAYVSPVWRKSMSRIARLGDHIFYKLA